MNWILEILVNGKYKMNNNSWFRDKWNRLDKLKDIEENWFDKFNSKVEDEILRRRIEIDKKYNGNKK